MGVPPKGMPYAPGRVMGNPPPYTHVDMRPPLDGGMPYGKGPARPYNAYPQVRCFDVLWPGIVSVKTARIQAKARGPTYLIAARCLHACTA